MEQIKEAVYLINDERYLHLRENGAGVGFAMDNKKTSNRRCAIAHQLLDVCISAVV